jgi:hypothetical protein
VTKKKVATTKYLFCASNKDTVFDLPYYTGKKCHHSSFFHSPEMHCKKNSEHTSEDERRRGPDNDMKQAEGGD